MRHRQLPRLGALLAGGLPALAFPEAGLWWLGFAGLVPCMLLVLASDSAREGGLRGWIAGAGFMVAVHHWLLPNVTIFAVPLAAGLGTLWIPWAVLAWALRDRRWTALAVVPSAWTAAEFVRSWERLGGPWGLLGSSQWTTPVIDLAALGGVWAVGFALVVVNLSLTYAIARTGRVPMLAVAAVVVAASLGFAAAWDPPARGEIRVAGVQAGIVPGPAARLRALEARTRSLGGRGARLVVWGESSVGTVPGALARVAETARDVDAPVLANVDARRGSGGIFKSSILVGPDGPVAGYDKMRLVPFGEYVPARPVLGWLSRVTRAAAEDRRRGTGLALFRSGDTRIGPLVCFESSFPDMTRRLVEMGADVIVVQSSTSTFQESWGPEQHAALAAVRAVETGRPLVHATLTGVSAAFDASGRRLAWVGTDRRGTYVVDLPLTSVTTPYVRFGDWVVWVSFGALMAVAAASGLRRRSSRTRSGGAARRAG